MTAGARGLRHGEDGVPSRRKTDVTTLTRHALLQILDEPTALAELTARDLKPVDLERKVAEILSYLKETRR